MPPTYTDNQVPIGSRVEAIKRGVGAGTDVGSYVFESLSLDRPSTVVTRKDQIGKENGWALVDGVGCTGSGVIQIATAATQIPRNGDWFKDAFDGSSTAQEQWVITKIGQPFAHDAYFKCNVDLKLSSAPPTA